MLRDFYYPWRKQSKKLFRALVKAPAKSGSSHWILLIELTFAVVECIWWWITVTYLVGAKEWKRWILRSPHQSDAFLRSQALIGAPHATSIQSVLTHLTMTMHVRHQRIKRALKQIAIEVGFDFYYRAGKRSKEWSPELRWRLHRERWIV